MLTQRGLGLEAFTAVPAHAGPSLWQAPVAGDEWALASATASRAGVSVHLPVRAEGSSILASVRRYVEIHDGPGHGVANYHWLLDLLALARDRGHRVLLTGQAGNATVSASGEPTWGWTSLGQGNLPEAWRAFAGAEANPWLAFKRQVLKPLLVGPLQARRRRRALHGEIWLTESALQPALSRGLRLGERMRAQSHDPSFSTSQGPASLALLGLGRSEGGAIWQALAADAGLEARDPTADRRLIAFCLRLPPSQLRRRGQDRWLFRRAMQGRMPEEILRGDARGLQASDLAWRVHDEKGALLGALEGLARHPLVRECLDLARLREILLRLDPADGWNSYDECGCILLRSLAAGLFLSRL